MADALTKPCEGCPFRRDGKGVRLRRDRIREIAATVTRGGGFHCHNTLDMERPGRIAPDSRLCGGALAFTLNTGDEMAKTVVQIRLHGAADRIAAVEESRAKVYSTLDEWLAGGSFGKTEE